LSSLPLLSSRPGAPVTVHLDFDGTPAFEFDDADDQWASGPALGDSDPIPAFSIDPNVNDYTQGELDGILAIWQHVSEKFSPFDINVTTVAPASYPDGQAIHAIIGGSNMDWAGGTGGGIAPLNAFTNGRPNSAFAWSRDAVTNFNGGFTNVLQAATRHFIAETVAHEVGHTLGLRHQSTVDGLGNVTVEYSNGTGTTAPIMGASSLNSGNRGQWLLGPSSSNNNGTITYQGIQDDLAVMTRPGNFINYRPDDYGSFSSSGSISVDLATGVATASGVIETNGDQDAFTFTAIAPVVSFTVNNAALGGMLAPTLELIPIGAAAAGTVTLTTTNTSATLGATGLTPGGGYVLRVSRKGTEYGSLGQYTITGNTGTFAVLNAGVLTISGFDTVNDLLISYHSGTDNIVLQDDVFGGSAVQQFPRSQVNEIRVDFGSYFHDDEINILGQFSGLNIPIDVFAGDVGTDTLILHGTTGADVMSMNGNGFALTSNSTTIFSLSIERYILTGFDGADTYNINAVAQNRLVTVNGGGGNDVINVGTGTLDPDRVRSPVTVNGEGDDDTLNLGGGWLDSIDAPVTFNGGGVLSAVGNRVILHDQTSFIPYEYAITPTTVTREADFAGLSFFSTQRVILNASAGHNIVTVGNGISPIVEVNGNDGDDNFIVGGGLIAPLAGQVLNGGNGVDQITFDDHLRTENRFWDIHDDRVIYGGLFNLLTTGFESVGVLAGNGNDQIYFYNAIDKPITVDGGGGDDYFDTNASRANLLTLIGGGGQDSLDIDDRGIAANIDENVFTPTSVSRIRYPDQINPGATYTVNSSQFELMHVYLPNQQNYTTIYGSPPDITPGFAAVIHGNSSNDAFVLVPRDNNDNLTLYSNLTIDGGAESDSVSINDARSLPINYTFANPFGPTITHISGMGGQLGITNTIEGLTLNAGGGGDTFNLNSYDSSTALAINGGAGNDTVNWTPLGNNLAEISSMASFNYNGGADSDSMYVYNGSSPSGFGHYVSPGVLSTIRHSDAKQWVMPYANLEQVTVFATQLNDAFQIFGTSPGVAHALYGQGGTNSYSVGGIFPTTVQGVNSPVQIFGSGGTDNIILRNDEDNLARTYHVSQNTVGAAPGDNLFGPGGYVGFHSLVGTLTINNGNGADTIYAQPNISTALAFHGSNPTAAPGDTLNLVFAEVLDPVFTPGGTGAGGYTFGNRAPLNYTGIETGPTIDLGPVLLSDYSENNSVDAADYVVWRKTFGQYVAMYRGADGSGNGNIGPEDYGVWRQNFGKSLPASVVGIPFNGYYSQTFDTLPTGGASLAWSNDSTLAGWFLYRQPSPGTSITTINAGDGSSSTGSFYSFGVLGSGALEDRALGGLGSGGAYFGSPATGTVAGWMALALTNDTDATIDALTLSFDGEQWRNGGNTVAQTVVLEYGFGSSFATVSTWTAPGGNFDFTSPIHTATASAVDGNSGTNRAAGLGGTLNSLGWAPGSTLWFRWVERNDAGNDHALAIDDVEIVLPSPAAASSFASRLESEQHGPTSVNSAWQASSGTQAIVAAALVEPVAPGGFVVSADESDSFTQSSTFSIKPRPMVDRASQLTQQVKSLRQETLLWLTQAWKDDGLHGDAPNGVLASAKKARERYYESFDGDLSACWTKQFCDAAEVIAIQLASTE